jgi:hypothetical protein
MSILLKPETETLLINRAAAKGYNIDDYVKKLVEEDSNKMQTLDEIFAPFRKHTEKISEEELDDLVMKARREIFAEKKNKSK